jgi:PII-like signaling protein
VTLAGEQILLRIYLRSADRAPHVPTWELLLKAARKSGMAGATVLYGILGLGSRGFARPSNWALLQQVPVILEIVETPEKVREFVAGPMRELMHVGMATLERAYVMLYRNRAPRAPAELAPAPETPPLSTLPEIDVGGRMKTKETGILLRIFIGESDQHEHQSLYEAIVQKVRQLGGAGATVLRGTEGFGATSIVHRASLLEMSTDLPIVIEIVDNEEKIRELLPHLEQMVTEGLITMEHVTVLLYRHDPERPVD